MTSLVSLEYDLKFLGIIGAAAIPVSGNVVLSMDQHSNKAVLDAADGTVLTVDARSLRLGFKVVVLLPVGGSISIVSANGALLDGDVTTQTRTYDPAAKVITILGRAIAGSFAVLP
jgi:hypothetical protein